MAVALGHTGGVDQSGTANTSLSWTHDCTGDNVLIVNVSTRGNVTGMSVTFNGTAMTLISGPKTCTAGAYAEQRVFQLDSPAQGSYTVSVSWTTGAAAAGSSASFSGVTSVGQITQTAATFSYTKTVASGDMIVGCLAFADAGSNNGMTPTADKYNSGNTNWTGTAINHNSSTGSQSVSSSYGSTYTVGTGLYLSSASGIVFDNTSSGDFGGSPDTFTHICSGSADRILLVAVFSQGTISGATYNGVSMTSLGTYGYTSPTGNGALFMLVNPAAGPNTVSVSSSGNLIAVASSYTGAKQSGQPDAAINTQTSGGSNASSLTATVTVAAANSWLIAGTICEGSALTAGTGAHLRQTGSNPAVAIFDSNGAVSAGSQSMTVNESPSNKLAMGMVSFAVSSNTYNQSVTATISVTGVVTKGLSKSLVATTAVSGAVLKQLARSLIATTSVTASMVKQMSKTLVATTAVSASTLATKVYLQALTATISVTAAITKIPGKLLTATTEVSASIAKTASLVRTLIATTSVTGVITKGLSKTLVATTAVSASITKTPGILLTATTAVSASISRGISKLLVATTEVSATMQAGRAVIMIATVTTTATMEKTVGKLLRVTLAIIAKVSAPFYKLKYPSHGDGEDYEIKYPHE